MKGVENAQAPHASVSVANPALSTLFPAGEPITTAIMKLDVVVMLDFILKLPIYYRLKIFNETLDFQLSYLGCQA